MSLKRILLALSGLLLLIPHPVSAGGRVEFIQEQYTEYIWHIVGPDGIEFCRIITEEQAAPQIGLVRALCGDLVADQLGTGEMFINYLTSQEVKRDKKVLLPGIDIRLDVYPDVSTAVITASEPIWGEKITRLEARINDVPVVCEDNPCQIELRHNISTLEYWAESSYGDSTGNHRALIRLRDDFNVIGDHTYSGWNATDRIPNVWMTFPPKTPPGWLIQAGANSLETDLPYTYLAGKMILSGSLGVPDCENFGIIPYSGGYADSCGLEFAREYVQRQQNVYNGRIVQASRESGVPPWILKGIISQESQFWPGAHGHYGEYGLFQLSRIGADTLLRWSGDCYVSYCSELFDDCDVMGYDNREDWEKEALITSVMGDADDISLLGDVLTANAAQVAQLIENYLRESKPGQIMSYESLWKLTIVNYHAGPEFTAAVLHQIKVRDVDPSWYQLEKAIRDLNPGVLSYLYNVINLCDVGKERIPEFPFTSSQLFSEDLPK